MTMFRLGKWAVFGLAVCMLSAHEAKAGVGSSRFRPMNSR